MASSERIAFFHKPPLQNSQTYSNAALNSHHIVSLKTICHFKMSTFYFYNAELLIVLLFVKYILQLIVTFTGKISLKTIKGWLISSSAFLKNLTHKITFACFIPIITTEIWKHPDDEISPFFSQKSRWYCPGAWFFWL